MMLIVTVLKLSTEYKLSQAIFLHRQLRHFGYDAICLTDAEYIPNVKTYPFYHQFPGWWSKMELFNPKHKIIGNQSIFYMDLDTLILREFSPLMSDTELRMINDFYHPTHSQSGVMNINQASKKQIWKQWMRNASHYMNAYTRFPKLGDGALIANLYPSHMHFNSKYPGSIISYKKDFLKTKTIPKTANLMCFFGKPRPWDITIQEVLNYV